MKITLLLLVLFLGCAHARPIGDSEALLSLLRWPAVARNHDTEVRLWLDHGLFIPRHLIRLQQTGSGISGTLVRWWPNDPETQALVHPILKRTFVDLQTAMCPRVLSDREVMACVQPLPDDRARELFQKLTSLDVWHLDDKHCRSNDEMIVLTFDSDMLLVETIRRGHYEHHEFGTSSPDDDSYVPRAAEIATFSNDLAALFDPP